MPIVNRRLAREVIEHFRASRANATYALNDNHPNNREARSLRSYANYYSAQAVKERKERRTEEPRLFRYRSHASDRHAPRDVSPFSNPRETLRPPPLPRRIQTDRGAIKGVLTFSASRDDDEDQPPKEAARDRRRFIHQKLALLQSADKPLASSSYKARTRATAKSSIFGLGNFSRRVTKSLRGHLLAREQNARRMIIRDGFSR